MKSLLKNILKRMIFEQTILVHKVDLGKRDFAKSYSKAIKISREERSYIYSFWNKYLNNRWAKKSFDIRWFDIYKCTNVDGHDLRYYIPDGYYYCVVDTFFSDLRKARVLDDKNMYDLYFSKEIQPATIIRKVNGVLLDSNYNIISKQDALNKCKNNGGVIIKPSIDVSAGTGISIWNSQISNFEELSNLLDQTPSAVVQDLVKQHKVLADFNDSCVNTIRLVTLILNNQVYVTSSTLIMGGKNAKTNHLHKGGIVCGIHPTGQLRSVAFDRNLNKYDIHPNGIKFSNVQIPNFNSCLDLVKTLAPRFLNVTRLISWDLTIDINGNPILIEPNLTWGGLCQIANGPMFGDYTEDVLDYIRHEQKLFYTI